MNKGKIMIITIIAITLLYNISCLYSNEVTIAYTGSLHGQLYECNCPAEKLGGIEKLFRLYDNIESPKVILDAGGYMNQESEEYIRNTKTILKVYEKTKIDAINVSISDIVYREKGYYEEMAKYNLPYVSCNIVDKITKDYLYEEYIIKRINNIRILIVGITVLYEGIVPGSNNTIEVINWENQLVKTVNKLEGMYDVLIVLSDMPRYNFKKMQLSNKPIIFAGADGYSYGVIEEGQQYALYCGDGGRYAGIVKIKNGEIVEVQIADIKQNIESSQKVVNKMKEIR